MPRLSHPVVTPLYAIGVLLRVYFENVKFRKEIKELLDRYAPLCRQFVHAAIEHRELNLQEVREGREFFSSLSNLLHEWKFRSRTAPLVLLLGILNTYYEAHGITFPKLPFAEFKDMPAIKGVMTFDELQHFPMKMPVRHLKLTVPALAMIFWGREEIKAKIAKRLKEYEDETKAAGLRESPSGLTRHGHWWYEHYVEGKTYDEIAQEEAYIAGGSVISYAKNVGAAVRRFSNLIDPDPGFIGIYRRRDPKG
jgi:hypothetical protein